MPRVVSLFLPARSTDRLRRTLGGAAPLAEAPPRPDRPQGEAACLLALYRRVAT
jgi:hypothetical protein